MNVDLDPFNSETSYPRFVMKEMMKAFKRTICYSYFLFIH